jgi:hypothetical protein
MKYILENKNVLNKKVKNAISRRVSYIQRKEIIQFQISSNLMKYYDVSFLKVDVEKSFQF